MVIDETTQIGLDGLRYPVGDPRLLIAPPDTGWVDEAELAAALEEISAGGVVDATALVKGRVKLAGDLGGTADAPTVPGLVGKAPSTGIAQSAVTDLVSDLAARQPLDSDLTAIAALSTSSFGRSLLALADGTALAGAIPSGTYVPTADLTAEAAARAAADSALDSVLTARRMPVALIYNSNLVENPFFNVDLAGWAETVPDADHSSARVGGPTDTDLPTIAFTPADRGYSAIELVATAASSLFSQRSAMFPIDTTKPLVMRAWAKRMSGSTTAYVSIVPFSATGAELTPKKRVINGSALTTSWVHHDAEFAAGTWPAGTVYGRVEIIGAFSTIGVARFADLAVFPDENSVVPAATVGTYTGGHEMYRDPAGFVWVVSHYGLSVSKFDPNTRARLLNTVLPGSGYLHDIHGDGTHAWVVDVGAAPNDLYKIRLSDGALVGQFTIPGPSTVFYGVRCFGGYVWCGGGNGANSRLVRFDPAAETFTVYDIGLDVSSNNVSIVNDDTHLYVGSQVTKEIIKVTTAGVVAQRFTLAFSPYGIGTDGTWLYAGGTTFMPSTPGVNQRSEIVRIRISDSKTERHQIKWGAEANWKYDGARFMYSCGSTSVGGPTSLAIIRWDTQTGAVECFEFPLLRHKAVEVVGEALWAVGYHYPEPRFFRR